MDNASPALKAVPYVLLGISLVLLVARSFFGFYWTDEGFYLSLVDRLYRGGALFVDEWHPAQVFAPLLLPFYAAYVGATGGTAGIVLFFRLLYACLSFATALAGYLVLKREFGRFSACCIALLYLLYAHNSMLGTSPHSLCTTFFMLGLMLSWCSYVRIRDVRDDGSPDAQRVFVPLGAGICFALAIVCNLYVMIVFLLACLTGLIFAVMFGRAKMFLPFAWAMAGAALVAALYLMFVFRASPPGQVLDSLPVLLANGDETMPAGQRLPDYLSYMPVSRIGFIGTWFLVIFLVIWRASGHGVSRRFRTVVIGLDTLCLALAACAAFAASTLPGLVFLAFAEFALPCFLLQEDVRFSPLAHPELHLFWIPGIMLSLVWQFSGNPHDGDMLIGFMIANMGAFITVKNAVPTAQEMLPNSINRPAPGWLRALCLVLICSMVGSAGYLRIAGVHEDCTWHEMTATVQDGPAKGLRTSEQHVREYEGVRELAGKIDDAGGVWMEPAVSWAYLEASGICAVPSTRGGVLDQADASLYYASENHEYPEWVLVAGNVPGDVVSVVAGRSVPVPRYDAYRDFSAQLREHLDADDDYVALAETGYGVLYKKAKHEQVAQG